MTRFLRPASLVLAVAMLAGCGSTSLLGSTASDALSLATRGANGATTADGQKGPGKGGPGGQMKGGPGAEGGPGFALFADLELTDEQKAKIQAIDEANRPAKPAAPEAGASAKPERPENKLQVLLTAETFDEAAVRAALAERPTPPAKGDRPDPSARLVAVRAVLTEAQIAKIVAKLEAEPAADANRPSPDANRPSPPAKEDMATKLGLTDDQKTLLAAFEAKMEANRPSPPAEGTDPRAAHRAAELAFWKTGDASALQAAEPAKAEPPAFPVDEFVALAASLSVEQRKALLLRGPGMGGPGGHGGPGGPGGHEGPGMMGGRGHEGGPMGGPEGGPRGEEGQQAFGGGRGGKGGPMGGPMGGPRGPKPDGEAPAAPPAEAAADVDVDATADAEV